MYVNFVNITIKTVKSKMEILNVQTMIMTFQTFPTLSRIREMLIKPDRKLYKGVLFKRYNLEQFHNCESCIFGRGNKYCMAPIEIVRFCMTFDNENYYYRPCYYVS